MKKINIQSISDLITNSSTEVFIVYSKSNIDSIKELTNSILSLLDPSKKFDDYFNIEMLINYDEFNWIFERYSDDSIYYKEIPELETYKALNFEEALEYIKSLPLNRVQEIFNWAIDIDYYEHLQRYKGFKVTAKNNNPIVEKVAAVINNIDTIFDIDYFDNY